MFTYLATRESNHSRIFFVETSGKGNISLRFLTAVESAALWNRDKEIIVYLFTTMSQNLSPSMIGLRKKYPNIEYKTTTLDEFVRHTPLELWYREGKWKQSKWISAHVSDGVRFLELWRSGGIYMDLDILTLRRLNFSRNAVMWENTFYIASGCIAVQKDHPLMFMALNHYIQQYDPLNYVKNGPPVITDEYKKYKDILGEDCDGELLPVGVVSPTIWDEGLNYFKTEKTQLTIEKTKDSLAAHWWNDLSKDMRIEANFRCAFMELVKKNCPFVYSEILKVGWV